MIKNLRRRLICAWRGHPSPIMGVFWRRSTVEVWRVCECGQRDRTLLHDIVDPPAAVSHLRVVAS